MVVSVVVTVVVVGLAVVVVVGEVNAGAVERLSGASVGGVTFLWQEKLPRVAVMKMTDIIKSTRAFRSNSLFIKCSEYSAYRKSGPGHPDGSTCTSY